MCADWRGFFSSDVVKFLPEYFMYFKKIWQSMTEKDPTSGVQTDAKQVLRPETKKHQAECFLLGVFYFAHSCKGFLKTP